MGVEADVVDDFGLNDHETFLGWNSVEIPTGSQSGAVVLSI